MTRLRHRSTDPEWMDGEDVGAAEFAACIEDLARVNTVTMARPPTLAFIDRAFRGAPKGATLTIVDVGFGAGDMLRAVARHLAGSGRSARLIGYDINPRSEPVARLSGGQHQAGTCRMGTDPKESVTDSWGRVWGHDNLFVSDGSLHPTNGGFNPALTIMALALRNGQHIEKSLP